MREFRCPDDGRQWQVWAVEPTGLLAGGAASADERRRRERRVIPVESLADPPVLQRRRGRDRRAAQAAAAAATPSGTPARRSPMELLPVQWRRGWLVFQCVVGEGAAETRATHRLSPIPDCWDLCSEADLVEHLREAGRSTNHVRRARQTS